MDKSKFFEVEREFWDREAKRFSVDDLDLSRLSPDLVGGFKVLGDVTGKTVLDCGCGTGTSACYLARSANVYAFDISEEMVKVTEQLAKRLGVDKNLHCKWINFYDMSYDEEGFDLVFGSYILHHLPDLGAAGKEIERVLRPGGKAVFVETWGENPVTSFIRGFVLKRFASFGSMASPTEHPLRYADVNAFGQRFSRYQLRFPYFCFFRLGHRLTWVNWLRRRSEASKWMSGGLRLFRMVLDTLDDLTGKFFPFLRKYSYVVVIEVIK